MSSDVGGRCCSDPMWLWLWLWPWPAAVASIRPLAWELPYAKGAALKKTKTKTEKPKKLYDADERNQR